MSHKNGPSRSDGPFQSAADKVQPDFMIERTIDG